MTMERNLREQMNLPHAPSFEMELPPGWHRREVTPEALEELLKATKGTVMKAHQPQLYGALDQLIRQAFDGMKRSGAFAFFAPIEAKQESPSAFASLLARVRRSQDGSSLDALVSEYIRFKGAAPLLGDKRTLRYEEEDHVRIESETLVNHSITYLTPIPGSQRRRALELMASIVRPLAVPVDSPLIIAQKNLMDLCVSSLRWSPTAAADS